MFFSICMYIRYIMERRRINELSSEYLKGLFVYVLYLKFESLICIMNCMGRFIGGKMYCDIGCNFCFFLWIKKIK